MIETEGHIKPSSSDLTTPTWAHKNENEKRELMNALWENQTTLNAQPHYGKITDALLYGRNKWREPEEISRLLQKATSEGALDCPYELIGANDSVMQQFSTTTEEYRGPLVQVHYVQKRSDKLTAEIAAKYNLEQINADTMPTNTPQEIEERKAASKALKEQKQAEPYDIKYITIYSAFRPQRDEQDAAAHNPSSITEFLNEH